MSEYVPIGMPDDVAYRLHALDKRRLRWPALHLFAAVAAFGVTLFALHTIAR